MRSALRSIAALLSDKIFAPSPMSSISIALLILLISGSPLETQGQQMKLLSPGAGWVGYLDTLYFTRDNGEHWSDITPHPPDLPSKAAALGPIFFRDASEGWAIVSYPEKIYPLTPQAMRNQRTVYVVMHTENSGESWGATPLAYPALPEWIEETFAGPASIFFLDSIHGWMDMAYAGMEKPGKLLATEDGGQTWNWVNSPPFSGQIQFTSLNDGWLINSWGGDELYATHDGAKSWQKVKLTPPQGIRPTDRSLFSMPQFQDRQVGYLPVKYVGLLGAPSKLVVYTARSSGKLWHSLKSFSIPADVAFAMADSTLVLPVETDDGQLSTMAVSVFDQSQPAVRKSASDVLALSFHGRSNRWALRSNGLYETGDSGATWVSITPPRVSPTPSGRKVVVPSKSELNSEGLPNAPIRDAQQLERLPAPFRNSSPTLEPGNSGESARPTGAVRITRDTRSERPKEANPAGRAKGAFARAASTVRYPSPNAPLPPSGQHLACCAPCRHHIARRASR